MESPAFKDETMSSNGQEAPHTAGVKMIATSGTEESIEVSALWLEIANIFLDTVLIFYFSNSNL
jgi:hypothetical protein